MRCEGEDSKVFAKDSVQWQALGNAVMTLRFA
jgi:hypothetical protein